ncbi:hypothetical protein D9758_015053 [Tetrapyrgos nigripes]|uniref:Aminotransferase class I/classII large domain-containing protein n=1 Tax=Tetrapyrgos nigripes TaxID=182062 RepID=A0A8H5CU94_9AGAR|nr:hypothetical protein D9758_015053 [Tetrapyrgos nigripes]
MKKTPGGSSSEGLFVGKSHPETFPFKSLSFGSVKHTNFAAQNSDLLRDFSLNIDIDALVTGLPNHNFSDIPDLARWLENLQYRMHGRSAGEGWRISMGSGSRALIYRFRVLMLEQTVQAMVKHRDPIFVESLVYADIIPMFETICNPIGVETDAFGICAESLRKTLESWPPGKPKPKFLYTIPYGCNPTGITATTERRKEILKLAREHDFIILEDDPYYYLYYGPADRPPSYFALEATERTENGQCEVGRVVRFDSLTMILSTGISIGWASGPEELLARIERHPIGLIKALWLKHLVLSDVSVIRFPIDSTFKAWIRSRSEHHELCNGSTPSSYLQATTLTQVIANALLSQWGYDGFNDKTRSVSSLYRQKRDIFEAAMQNHLEGLAEWQLPDAGMFFWFKLLVPDSANIDVEALRDVVRRLPGAMFWQNGNSGYVRVSFSQPTKDEADKGLKRLGSFLRKEIGSAQA